MTKRMVHFGAVLGVVCAAAALGVSGTYRLTQEPIKKSLADKQKAALALLFDSVGASPAGVLGGKGDDRVFKATAGKDGGHVAAYAAVGSGQGYSSRIRVLAAVDADCRKVLAIFITYQAETPGLGTQVTDVKPDATWGQVLTGQKNPLATVAAQYEPPRSVEALSGFQKQFSGVPVESLKLGDGVDGITGATISSRGAMAAVNQAVERIRRMVGRESAK